MELTKILPNLPEIIKEVVKQTLKIIMIAEREVFLKENGGIKNGFYTRNFDTLLGKLEDLKIEAYSKNCVSIYRDFSL